MKQWNKIIQSNKYVGVIGLAELKPFKALRFTEKAGDISELCCPPYDIIDDTRRREYLAKNEHNIIRLELPRDGEDYYAEASKVLHSFLSEGILAEDDCDSFYIYGERFSVDGKEYEFKGIIGRVKIEEFSKGVVLPHEETLSKAKEDRFRLMQATMCNFSQIYSLYKDENGETSADIERLSVDEPVVRFTDDDGVTHSLWRVTDKADCDRISAEFANRKLYIADGHHRYETALNFRNYLRETGAADIGEQCDYVMMMLVAMESSGLVVFPTHRIVRGIKDFDKNKVLEVCGDCFSISEKTGINDMESLLKAEYAAGRTSFAYYIGGGKWYMMTLNSGDLLDKMCPEYSDALKNLDVNVLHKLVLERSFGIDKENMSNQKNLSYTRDINEAVSLVDGGQADCCFIMNPTRVSEISDVAAAGEKMPQKSTYFYPKLITGLVMNKFGDI